MGTVGFDTHPALAEYETRLRDFLDKTPCARVYFGVPIPATVREVLEASDEGPTGPGFQTLVLTRRRAAQSFDTRYGGYVWDVWVDRYGRCVVVADHAEWVPNPMAFMYGKWGSEVIP